jgi:arsenate reductase (thioredoxin)
MEFAEYKHRKRGLLFDEINKTLAQATGRTCENSRGAANHRIESGYRVLGQPDKEEIPMKGDSRQKILFLSTGNSVRSIFAEYFIQKIAGDRFEAYSAGSQPTGTVDPLALQLLQDLYHIDPRGAHSKSWEEFKDARFDIIITVCDGAKESCPLFSGQPQIAHWNIPDPTRATGAKEIDKYRDVAQQILQRVQLLCMFPMEKLGHLVPQQSPTP